MIDTSIFKAYDIRGIYPEQLNEECVYKIGRAFVDFLKVKEVAVGYDMRVSTPKLLPHLIQGINDAGAKVIDIGFVGTEVMYFAVGHFKYESGIMITASHNPAEYNGMKMVEMDAKPIGADNGIYDIRDLAANADYKRKNVKIKNTQIDPFPEFKKKIREIADFTKFKPIKIVIDAGNGMGGYLFDKVFTNTPFKIKKMYFEPNGNFPNHQADPMKEENTKELRKRVVESESDLGISYDGDGDRCVFADAKGEIKIGYFIQALLLQKILKKKPGSTIVYENRNKWAIEDAIQKYGGKGAVTKPGHTYIKLKMREVDGEFGGETSSHFYYKALHYADSSMATTALMLELMSESKKSLEKLLSPLSSKYFISGEINFKVDDADNILARIKKYYQEKGFIIDELDGIAVDNDRNWRFSLRKSNTEPLVRLNVEGKSQEVVDQITEEVEKIIEFPRT